MTRDRGSVERALAWLARPVGTGKRPATTADVAKRLAKLNCHGDREACQSCPVVRFLDRRLPWLAFRVDGSVVDFVPRSHGFARIPRDRMRLPSLIRSTILDFDCGHFPFLEAA